MSLKAQLVDHIKTRGPLSLHSYMERCLQDPVQGYYRKANPLGTDFITAPEVSQIFGEMLGLWFASCWQNDLGRGGQQKKGKTTLLEFGPGQGTLMQDFLRATAFVPGFHEDLELVFFESSDPLRQIQEQAIAPFGLSCRWVSSLENLEAVLQEKEDGSPLFFLGNEFLDALPVRRLFYSPEGWREWLVSLDPQENFVFSPSPVNPDLAVLSPPWLSLETHKAPFSLEVSPQIRSFITQFLSLLAPFPSLGLWVDYGYTQPYFEATVQAVSHHQQKDIFDSPGDQDLTAHVDFLTLAYDSQYAGFEVYGVQEQGHFLQNIGAEHRLKALQESATSDQALLLKKGYERLSTSAQMGRLFKVLALGSISGLTPPGFPIET